MIPNQKHLTNCRRTEKTWTASPGIYPPEEEGSQHWQKTADELGNRTAKWVASWVQKYYIKLIQVGIPVPGRLPTIQKVFNKQKTAPTPLISISSNLPPLWLHMKYRCVCGDEDDDRSCFHDHMNTALGVESYEESIPITYRNLPKYQKMITI